jgi:hypothetical protein
MGSMTVEVTYLLYWLIILKKQFFKERLTFPFRWHWAVRKRILSFVKRQSDEKSSRCGSGRYLILCEYLIIANKWREIEHLRVQWQLQMCTGNKLIVYWDESGERRACFLAQKTRAGKWTGVEPRRGKLLFVGSFSLRSFLLRFILPLWSFATYRQQQPGGSSCHVC